MSRHTFAEITGLVKRDPFFVQHVAYRRMMWRAGWIAGLILTRAYLSTMTHWTIEPLRFFVLCAIAWCCLSILINATLWFIAGNVLERTKLSDLEKPNDGTDDT